MRITISKENYVKAIAEAEAEARGESAAAGERTTREAEGTG